MVRGVGIDLVENRRIEKALKRWQGRFEARVYSDREMEYCRRHASPVPHYAGRFAAKEAFIKCTGGFPGMRLREIEILNDGRGRPCLHLSGEAKKRVETDRILRIHLSITHTEHYASAVVILEA